MGYKVRTEPGGHEFMVEAGETILEAALRSGRTFPYGCRNGFCGSCRGIVLKGKVDYGAYPPAILGEDEVAGGVVLMCQTVPLSDLRIQVQELSAAQDIPVRRLPCRIAKIERPAPDVMCLLLKLPDGERLQFLAGQYIDVILPDGRRRSFSIANPPHDDQFSELHIRHIPGGQFTDYVFGRLREKDVLHIEGPYGNFFLREDSARPLLLTATGTGFAPVKAIIEHALAEGVTRPMALYWGARKAPDLYMAELAQGWAERHENFRFVPMLSRPTPEDHWQGRRGYVQDAIIEDFPDLSGFDLYACGLPEMIETSRILFAAHGLPQERFFSDAFEFTHDPAEG